MTIEMGGGGGGGVQNPLTEDLDAGGFEVHNIYRAAMVQAVIQEAGIGVADVSTLVDGAGTPHTGELADRIDVPNISKIFGQQIGNKYDVSNDVSTGLSIEFDGEYFLVPANYYETVVRFDRSFNKVDEFDTTVTGGLPYGIASANGLYYVLVGDESVHSFETDGTYVEQVGSVTGLMDLSYYGGRFYSPDYNTVYVYDEDFNQTNTLSSAELSNIQDVVVDGVSYWVIDDNFDQNDIRVKRFDSDFNFTGYYRSIDGIESESTYPTGFTFDGYQWYVFGNNDNAVFDFYSDYGMSNGRTTLYHDLIDASGSTVWDVSNQEVPRSSVDTHKSVSSTAASTFTTSGEEVVVANTDVSGNPIEIVLASADAVEGNEVIVKDGGQNASSNNVTIATEGSEDLDRKSALNSATPQHVINTDNAAVRLVWCDTGFSSWLTVPP